MSTNKTCAISSLRWRPVSELIYDLADFSKHESAPTTVAEIRLEQQKTEKISSILRTGERKGSTIFARTDNPDTGAGIICCLSNRRRHDKVSGVLPRRWRNYSALLARDEQTIHAGSRPEKMAVAREIA